jgi:addiction module RelE/StbE family toxin
MQQLIIRYGEVFLEDFSLLSKITQRKAVKAGKLFQNNMFHPSLRLHKLHGKLKDFWSISVDKKHRIIFQYVAKDTVLFFSVGSHAIYEDMD